MAVWHVTPNNDLKEHEESASCHCNPTCKIDQETGDMIIVHNSYDGREHWEEMRDEVSKNLN